MWDRAEGALAAALEDAGASSTSSTRATAPSTGPKIDLHMTDSLGRSWQLGTVQLDYSMPERFDLHYTGADNAEHRPVMIHRALFGSFERFIGILIEHYGGELPVWLAPVQAIVLPVSDRFNEYAAGVTERLRAGQARVELDDRSETWRARSATPSCARSPTCSSSGSASRARTGLRARASRRGAREACPLAGVSRASCGGSYTRPALITGKTLSSAPDAQLDARQAQLVPVPRRFDRRPPERDMTRINDRIRVPEVRLIDDEGNQVGVLKTPDALVFAQERDLDLVEVAPEARPPVCRVLDYSKYKYEQAQKQ